MKNIKIISFFVVLLFIFNGCVKEDFVGHSSETPTKPTISVDLGTIILMSDKSKSTHTIHLTMSVAQIVDVAVYVTVLSGDATIDEDYTLSETELIIKAGRTSVNLDVTILADEIFEPTETFKIQIGDARTANATITPVTAEFTISNATRDDLVLALAWDSDVIGLDGEKLDAKDVADMYFSIFDKSGNPYVVTSGTSTSNKFEKLTLKPTDLADGVYLVRAFFKGVMNLGAQGGAEISLTLAVSQVGIQSKSYSYDKALNTLGNTLDYHMIKITKSGNSWKLENIDKLPIDLDNFMKGSFITTDPDGDTGFCTIIDDPGVANGYIIDRALSVWGTNLEEGNDGQIHVIFSLTDNSVTFNPVKQATGAIHSRFGEMSVEQNKATKFDYKKQIIRYHALYSVNAGLFSRTGWEVVLTRPNK